MEGEGEGCLEPTARQKRPNARQQRLRVRLKRPTAREPQKTQADALSLHTLRVRFYLSFTARLLVRHESAYAGVCRVKQSVLTSVYEAF
jgi:hypothetical protein